MGLFYVRFKRMHILHLIYDHMQNPWVGGGGAVRAYELNKRLAKRGHRVLTVSGNYPGAMDYEEENLAFKFMGSAGSYLSSTFSYALNAAGFVKKHGRKFDMIVEDFAPWNPLFSKFLTKKPVILIVHHKEGAGILKRRNFLGLPFYLIEKAYPKFFPRVIAVSEETKRKFGLPGAKVILAGIDEELMPREPLPEEERGDYVLFMGRLHIKNKGIDTLLEAMKKIPETRFVVLGRGPDEERVKEMAKGLRVEFMGFLKDMKKIELLRRAKLFLFPSRFEGFGIAALEAGAAGTPVIASDIPELSFVRDGGFGLSFRKGDPDDLAQKINALLKDHSLRAQMGRKGIEFARECTWEKRAAEYEKYLLENSLSQ